MGMHSSVMMDVAQCPLRDRSAAAMANAGAVSLEWDEDCRISDAVLSRVGGRGAVTSTKKRVGSDDVLGRSMTKKARVSVGGDVVPLPPLALSMCPKVDGRISISSNERKHDSSNGSSNSSSSSGGGDVVMVCDDDGDSSSDYDPTGTDELPLTPGGVRAKLRSERARARRALREKTMKKAKEQQAQQEQQARQQEQQQEQQARQQEQQQEQQAPAVAETDGFDAGYLELPGSAVEDNNSSSSSSSRCDDDLLNDFVKTYVADDNGKHQDGAACGSLDDLMEMDGDLLDGLFDGTASIGDAARGAEELGKEE